MKLARRGSEYVMSMRKRIMRLEESREVAPCGQGCPPLRVEYVNDWRDEPRPAQPMHYPRGGRPARILTVVFDDSFYGHAERLARQQAQEG
jgi:hypothetical protein